VYQFRYQGSSWSVTTVASAGGPLYKAAWGDADGSGAYKLYAGCGDGHVYQFRFENSTWQTADLGSAQTPLYALALGDADNDNQYEVYALGDNSHAYQFKLVSLPTPTISPTAANTPVYAPEKSFKIYHSQINPLRNEQARLRWTQPQDGPATIKIYNLLGDKIITLVNQADYTSGCFNEADWNGKTQSGKAAGSGIYIAVLEAPGYKATAKAAIVK
jgi:hypothetical protein